MSPYLVNLLPSRRDDLRQFVLGAPDIDSAISNAYCLWPGRVLDVVDPDGNTYLLVSPKPGTLAAHHIA